MASGAFFLMFTSLIVGLLYPSTSFNKPGSYGITVEPHIIALRKEAARGEYAAWQNIGESMGVRYSFPFTERTHLGFGILASGYTLEPRPDTHAWQAAQSADPRALPAEKYRFFLVEADVEMALLPASSPIGDIWAIAGVGFGSARTESFIDPSGKYAFTDDNKPLWEQGKSAHGYKLGINFGDQRGADFIVMYRVMMTNLRYVSQEEFLSAGVKLNF